MVRLVDNHLAVAGDQIIHLSLAAETLYYGDINFPGNLPPSATYLSDHFRGISRKPASRSRHCSINCRR